MDDQAETIAFLASPGGLAGNSECPQTIATHISTVLLLGDKAIKLKKPVHFPYLDFSTPERRLAACNDELRLNRRTAPGVYRAVHRVTRENSGQLALDGQGELVDGVVEMTRFDNELLFDRLASNGRLTIAHMDKLANQIAHLHATAEIVDGEGAKRFERVIRGNELALAARTIFRPDDVARVSDSCHALLNQKADLLDRRGRSGHVRRCHGDLHLRNICLFDGVPTLFDCLEFNEELATTDVLYDLAFVLMDLWHRSLPLHANVLLNRYLDATGDDDGVALLPLFMAVRAVIRAHVMGSEVAQTELSCAWKRAEARAYLDLAADLLAERPAILVAVGGYSGSGKSTVATRIAPALGFAPGARILSSDRIRKRLFGVAPETQLSSEAYAPPVSEQVYATMARQADSLIAAGHAVVADAVFDDAPRRERISAVATGRGVPFHGLWLDAPADVLMRRVAARRGDPSDATPDLVMEQISRRRSAPTEWLTLCAVADVEIVADAALLAIGEPSTVALSQSTCPGRRIISSASAGPTCARAVWPATSTLAQKGGSPPATDTSTRVQAHLSRDTADNISGSLLARF